MSKKTSIIIAIIVILLGVWFVIYDKTSKKNWVENTADKDISIIQEQQDLKKSWENVLGSRKDAMQQARDVSRQSALWQLKTALSMYSNANGGEIIEGFNCANEDFFAAWLSQYIYKHPRDMNRSWNNYGCQGEYYFRKVDSRIALVAATMEGENGNYCGNAETLKNADIASIKSEMSGCENGQWFVELIEYGW